MFESPHDLHPVKMTDFFSLRLTALILLPNNDYNDLIPKSREPNCARCPHTCNRGLVNLSPSAGNGTYDAIPLGNQLKMDKFVRTQTQRVGADVQCNLLVGGFDRIRTMADVTANRKSVVTSDSA